MAEGLKAALFRKYFVLVCPKIQILKVTEAERVYKSFFSTLGCNSLSLLFVNLFVVSFAKYKFLVLAWHLMIFVTTTTMGLVIIASQEMTPHPFGIFLKIHPFSP